MAISGNPTSHTIDMGIGDAGLCFFFFYKSGLGFRAGSLLNNKVLCKFSRML